MSVSAWEELVATALIGTERRSATAPALTGRFGEAISALDWDRPERALLGAAALLSRGGAAGLAPAELGAPEPAPAASGRQASLSAIAVLGRVLAQPEFVPEALARLAESGIALPEALMPELLDAATTDRSWRRALLDAGGGRLRWLAAVNPRWSWATGAQSPVERWETGTAEERRAVLAELRAGDPAAGRALLESTWETDSPADRAGFLELLHDGLSLEDQTLLERALDDRRKPVRTAASGLLSVLPGSALRSRMGERLRPLIAVGGGLRSKLQIEVPEEIDKAGRRDGIEDSGAPPGFGVRAWWLSQIIRSAPLVIWEQRTALAPEAILKQVRGQEFATPVFEGLKEATRRERHAAWALAWMALDPSNAGALADVPAETANPLVLAALRKQKDDTEVLRILTHADWSWDPELSRAAVDRLRRVELRPEQVSVPQPPQGASTMIYYRRAHPCVVRRLDPDAAEQALPVLEALWPPPEFDTRSVLMLRHAIRQEIR